MRVELEQVTHEFVAGLPLFRPLSETFTAGETVAVSGPSGSGKSTLLAIAAGLVTPMYGHIRRPNTVKASWIPQNPHGVSGRTARDHIALLYLARGLTRDESQACANRDLLSLGLAGVGDQAFSTLSGGQAQRLMLARGIAAKPDILLIDEPTAQLDRASAQEIDRAIQGLAAYGLIVLVATHSETTRAACTRTIELQTFAPE